MNDQNSTTRFDACLRWTSTFSQLTPGLAPVIGCQEECNSIKRLLKKYTKSLIVVGATLSSVIGFIAGIHKEEIKQIVDSPFQPDMVVLASEIVAPSPPPAIVSSKPYKYKGAAEISNHGLSIAHDVSFAIIAPPHCSLETPAVDTYPREAAPLMNPDSKPFQPRMDINQSPDTRMWHVDVWPTNAKLIVTYPLTCAEPLELSKPSKLGVGSFNEHVKYHETSTNSGFDAGFSELSAIAPSNPAAISKTTSNEIDKSGANSKTEPSKPYQVGKASWYGKKFHGRTTASGEDFDMFELTAAHRQLPLGTYVKVTNLSNDKWVIVRINDRGPFVKSRIMDVSYSAARMLDFHAGVEKVRLDMVNPESIKLAVTKPENGTGWETGVSPILMDSGTPPPR